MLQIMEKNKCCGCEVCSNACPKNCIKMMADEKGFLYPEIDENKCIDCHLCEKVCPVLLPLSSKYEPFMYAIQNRDEKIRETSTSGGAFSAIAQWVLDKQGVVIGAAYDDQFRVFHKSVESEKDVEAFRGSKYVQSRAGEIYKNVRQYLEKDRWVCFSGTPCQVNGLKKYLQKEYEKLITIDLACRGITSPAFLKKYLEYHKNKEKSDIVSLQFREKYYGYGFSTMKIEFSNGGIYRAGMESDIFLRSFFEDLNTRESCHSCQFKTVKRVSDFTLFDGWHIGKFNMEMDDDKGTTYCMVQSEKGKKIIQEIEDKLKIIEISRNEGIRLDGSMVLKSTSPNLRREDFFEDIKILTIPQIQKKYYPLTFKRKILSKIKPLMYQIGIFKFYMKFKEVFHGKRND